MILTEEQKAVIDCKEHCLVLASAGSGKTSTIAEKIKHIKETESSKRVLYITFTRKAKQHAIEKLGHYNGVVVNNYHGLAYFIIGLNKAFFKINTVDIVNDSYCVKVLKSICKTNKDAIAVLKEIVNIKYHEIPYKEIKDDRLRSCYNHLEQVLEKQKKFTYADLIVKTNNLLKNNEFNMGTRRYLYFDYIFVDEFQDNYPGEYSLVLNLLKFSPNCKLTLIGDVFQCWHEDSVSNGKKIKDLKIGDLVESYSGYRVVKKQVKNIKLSSWTMGIKITTKSGRVTSYSPNHKIWAMNTPMDKFVVYLMYKVNVGFRIGVSNLKLNSNSCISVRQRMNQEGANLLWVLDVSDSEEKVRYLENKYSLKYGIPQIPFDLKSRGMYPMYNLLFTEFGSNGFNLLRDKNLSFYFPHYFRDNFTLTDVSKNMYVLTIFAHTGKKNSKGEYSTTQNDLRIEFTENEKLYNFLKKYLLIRRTKSSQNSDKKRYRAAISRKSYAEIEDIANKIRLEDSGFNFTIKESLALPNNTNVGRRKSPHLMLVSNLHKGMRIVNDDLQLDEIVGIETISGKFYDVEVEENRNMVADGILSHNSVYSFLGAVPELCLEFIDKMNPKLLPLSKNFRSQENIIKFSNDILADVKHFKELITPMSATIPPGDVPKFYYHDEAENEYYWVCQEIKHLVYSGYKYSDIVILFRFNRSGVEFDKMALSQSIPFELDRGSLINRKAILSVMTLVSFIQMAQDPLVDEESLLSYLEMFYGEVEDDINTKSLELVAKTYKEMPFLTKLAKIEMLKIKGLGQVKKVALYKFYKKIESMIALDLSTFSSINKIIDFVWDFKFVRKGSVQYHDSIREDFNILLDILGHTPGETLMDKINYLKVDFTQADNDDGVRNKVRGLTIHKAKGLEFKVVFYIQFDNDTLLSQMISNNDMHRLDQRLEEEKRVIYVGCTRAMEKLYLTSSRSNGFKTNLIATSKNLVMEDHIRRVYTQFDAELGG